MRYFLDAEFNGFGGQLISLALLPQDPGENSFYAALPCVEPIDWVVQNVMPVLRTHPISRPEMMAKLATYLIEASDPVVIADWPEDIAQLALLMISGP
jgi:hypothetical protein